MSEPRESAERSWLAWAAWLSAMVAYASVVAAFLWCYRQSAAPISARAHLYIEQLAHGHPFLANSTSGIDKFDTSPFEGKIYLYFGLTPFATLWLPLRALFSAEPSEAMVVLAYALGGAFFYGLATACALPRRQPTRGFWVAVAVISIAIGTGPFVLLRRPALYEVEIAAAFFFVAATLAALTASARWPRSSTSLIALAATALGLAIGSRPNLAVTAPLFLFWVYRENSESLFTRKLIGAALPLALIGGALAWFNWVRFHNPFEFGFGYQARAIEAIHPVFNAANVPYNLYRYLFGGAHLQPYFPFLAGVTPGPLANPVGHDNVDQVYGIAWCAPLIWSAVGLAKLRRKQISTAMVFAVAVAGTQLGVLCALGGGAYRYEVEMAAPLCWAGLVAVAQRGERTPNFLRRRAVVTLTVAAAACTVVLGALQNFSLYGILENSHHAAFEALARRWNQPVFYWQRLSGKSIQLPSAQITFPLHAAGIDEPLLVTGDAGLQDFLYVYYVSETQLQFGFESIGRGGTLSAPFTVDRAHAHRLTIAYGMLVPPGAPILKSFSRADQRALEHALTVFLDGRPVLDGWADFHQVKNRLQWGQSRDEAAFGARFTGTLLPSSEMARADFWSERFSPEAPTPVNLSVTKARLPVGTREPLLSAGLKNQGILFVLEHTSAQSMRIGCLASHAGRPDERFSEPIAWNDGDTREITILQSSTPTEEAPRDSSETSGPPAQHLVVKVYGRAVLAFESNQWAFAPSTYAVGENRLGLSGVTPALLIPAKRSSP